MGRVTRAQPGRAGERGESFVEVIVALLITTLFVTAVFTTIDTMLFNYNSQFRQSSVEVAIQRARADLEGQPFSSSGTYALPTVPPVTFSLQVTSITLKEQQLTVTATDRGATRQVTLFKTNR